MDHSFSSIYLLIGGLPWCRRGKESASQCRRCGFDPWVEKIPWRRKWQPTLVFLPGESNGQRNLGVTVHPVAKESDMTEQLNYNRHLGCFYLLTIVNNSAVHTGVPVSRGVLAAPNPFE